MSTIVPSGEKAVANTEDRSVKVFSNWPLCASHNFAVLSQLPVSTFFPSGENATEET